MKKSIPLKEIVGFLPYELKVFLPADELTIDLKEFIFDEEYYTNENDFRFIQPIVRPLSDLTKEITHNGETFVPIVKFAKIFGYDIQAFDEEDGIAEYGYTERWADDYQPFVFAYWQNGQFGLFYDTAIDSSPIYTFCSIESMDLLHELHIDFRYWIKDGLAVNINDL